MNYVHVTFLKKLHPELKNEYLLPYPLTGNKKRLQHSQLYSHYYNTVKIVPMPNIGTFVDAPEEDSRCLMCLASENEVVLQAAIRQGLDGWGVEQLVLSNDSKPMGTYEREQQGLITVAKKLLPGKTIHNVPENSTTELDPMQAANLGMQLGTTVISDPYVGEDGVLTRDITWTPNEE